MVGRPLEYDTIAYLFSIGGIEANFLQKDLIRLSVRLLYSGDGNVQHVASDLLSALAGHGRRFSGHLCFS